VLCFFLVIVGLTVTALLRAKLHFRTCPYLSQI